MLQIITATQGHAEALHRHQCPRHHRTLQLACQPRACPVVELPCIVVAIHSHEGALAVHLVLVPVALLATDMVQS